MMWRLSEELNRSSEAAYYRAKFERLRDNSRLEEMHWSAERQQFADFGLHSDGARLAKPSAFDDLEETRRQTNADLPHQARPPAPSDRRPVRVYRKVLNCCHSNKSIMAI